ncbi:MAG TPA: ROK family protein [bacterium]|nr:ROK family protein [bacterium]
MNKQDVYVGVDVGGTKILSCPLVFQKTGYRILGEEKKKTKPWKGVTEVIDRIVESIGESLAAARVALKDVRAIGLGLPGAVDAREGVVLFAPNIGWKKIQLKKTLESQLKVPCYLDNDVNLGAYGEYRHGAGAGTQNLIGIFWGTGVGGGIIIDGKIHRGVNFTAGEVGHMIVKLGGRKCGCGSRGCLEAHASRTAISQIIMEKMAQGRKSRIVIEEEDRKSALIRSGSLKKAYDEGDKLVCEIVDEAAETMGAGIATLINLLSPETVIVGGGVIESMGAALMPTIKDAAQTYSFPFAYKGVRIVKAKLGDYAVLVGAAQLAREQAAGK